MKTEIIRTDATNKDLKELIIRLDEYIRGKDGENHEFYPEYNTLKNVTGVVVAYVDKIAVGCGAFKDFNKNSVEVKRMFVDELYRGKEIAPLILKEIEKWAKELGYDSCVLETGKNMFSAINFYKKNGYFLIENYGPYVDAPNSVCFKKSFVTSPKGRD